MKRTLTPALVMQFAASRVQVSLLVEHNLVGFYQGLPTTGAGRWGPAPLDSTHKRSSELRKVWQSVEPADLIFQLSRRRCFKCLNYLNHEQIICKSPTKDKSSTPYSGTYVETYGESASPRNILELKFGFKTRS